MRLEILGSLSLPGDAAKANEDSFSQADAFAAVIDGATGLGERLMPGPSDAQWLAQFGARRLRAHALDGEGSPRDWLRRAAADAEKSYRALRKRAPVEVYETPLASLMMVAPHDGGLAALWFGDCALLVGTRGGVRVVGETIERRAKERDRAAALAKTRGVAPAAAGVREEFLPALRASRNRVNRPGGEWLFAPDAACADHAAETDMAVMPDAVLLLASDGFLALVSDYDRYTAETLLQAALQRGLEELGRELRAVEAEDPDGTRFARLKKSDDATALLLRLAE